MRRPVYRIHPDTHLATRRFPSPFRCPSGRLGHQSIDRNRIDHQASHLHTWDRQGHRHTTPRLTRTPTHLPSTPLIRVPRCHLRRLQRHRNRLHHSCARRRSQGVVASRGAAECPSSSTAVTDLSCNLHRALITMPYQTTQQPTDIVGARLAGLLRADNLLLGPKHRAGLPVLALLL